MAHILMILSNTCASPRTIDFALQLAQQEGGRVTGLFVLDPVVAERTMGQLSDSGFIGDMPSQQVKRVIEQEYRAQAEQRLGEAVQRFHQAGVPFEALLREGDFTATCLEVLEQKQPDRAVVCARPISNLRRWLLGSPVDELLRQMSCPTDVIDDNEGD